MKQGDKDKARHIRSEKKNFLRKEGGALHCIGQWRWVGARNGFPNNGGWGKERRDTYKTNFDKVPSIKSMLKRLGKVAHFVTKLAIL